MTVGVGEIFVERLLVDVALVDRFAELSGDRNPIHLEADVARSFGHGRRVAHGLLSLFPVSRLIGMRLPGQGTLWLKQSVEWLSPVYVGDELTITARVERISLGSNTLELQIRTENQKGELVMTGEATVKTSIDLTGEAVDPSIQRVALVVGGTRGIGAATANSLATRGFAVAINHRNSGPAATALIDKISSGGGSARAFVADVAIEAEDLVAKVIGAFGRIDVIVHCATPTIRPCKVGDLRAQDFEPYLRTYIDGTVGLVRGARESMAANRYGRIIVLGTSAMMAMPPEGWGGYLLAKHALFGLVRSLATELGPLGITSNMISPGLTVTELTEAVSTRTKEVEARRNPMRRIATPADTAELISYLASPAAGFINGANLPVSGGSHGSL